MTQWYSMVWLFTCHASARRTVTTRCAKRFFSFQPLPKWYFQKSEVFLFALGCGDGYFRCKSSTCVTVSKIRDSPVCPEAIHENFDIRVDLRPAARRYSKILNWNIGKLLLIDVELWQTGICGCDRLLSIVLSWSFPPLEFLAWIGLFATLMSVSLVWQGSHGNLTGLDHPHPLQPQALQI